MPTPVSDTPTDTSAVEHRREFDRQVDTLVERGYAELVGCDESELRARLAPLAARLRSITGGDTTAAAASERVPFVVVVPETGPFAARPFDTVTRVRLGTKAGFTTMEAGDVAAFVPQPANDGSSYDVPATGPYLLVGVDPGAEFRNVTPDDALPVILARGRTPLTIAEGIAVATHDPELFTAGHRYSLIASRCGDRRVPALWVSGGAPRLGWCWAAAPHTWLGSASAALRLN